MKICCHQMLRWFNFIFKTVKNIKCILFLSGFSFTDTDDSRDTRGRVGTIFYSILPIPHAHEHSDTYMQFCMWDDYHIFLIASFVFTRLLLDEIYHLIGLPFDWLMMWCNFCLFTYDLILGFCFSYLTRETGELKLATTVTLILQADQLTKCASHP